MMRSLWSAATGMQAQNLNIDVIANNLANVNTTGFKKSRADFQDLLYETLTPPGFPPQKQPRFPPVFRWGTGHARLPPRSFSYRVIFSSPRIPLIWPSKETVFFKFYSPMGR